MLELRTLAYFVAAADRGSFSAAAQALHVTQPTLSRQVGAMEDELCCELFSRGPAGLELTDAGETLYRYARQMLGLAEAARAETSGQGSKDVVGDVNLGAGETAALGLVGRAMVRLRLAHPGVRVNIEQGSAADLKERFNKGALDFLLETMPHRREDRETLVLPVHDAWGVALRADHPLAARPVLDPSDLAQLSLIASRRLVDSGFMDEWLGDFFCRDNLAATISLPSVGMHLVAAGVGAMFTYLGLPALEGVKVVPLSVQPAATVGLSWKRGFRRSAACQAFLDTVRQQCRIEGGDPDARIAQVEGREG